MTVLGPIPTSALGITLPHEHLFWDSTRAYHPREGEEWGATTPIQLSLLGALRRNEFLLKDNLFQSETAIAVREVLDFKTAGGGTIVDVTLPAIGRDAKGLKAVALATGVNIVAGCGYYVSTSHPPSLAERSIESVAEELTRELTEGIGETGIRAGIIGEIGVGGPMYGQPLQGSEDRGEIAPGEDKVLRASAQAQRVTGAAISVHIWNLGPNRLALRVLDVLEAAGADLSKVIICHLDNCYLNVPYMQAVAQRGAYVELDLFGIESYSDATYSQYPRDPDRIHAVVEMAGRGYLNQLLLSHDVCTKIQLKEYGGWGYEHLSKHIEPWFKHAGLTDAEIRTMRVENPQRVLAM